MPHSTTRPYKTNKTAGGFTIKLDDAVIGDVEEGNIVIGKENIDINNALTSRPKERLEFLLPPVITCTCVDIHWDTLSEILGIAESNISAGTDNYATDVGFTIYDDTMVKINGDSSKSGSDSIVLNSAAGGGGTTYTEDDDYVVDDTRGMVQCIPTGTHTLVDGTTVYVGSGTYTTTASKRILLQQDAIDTEVTVELEHTFSDGETLTIYLYKANVTSDLTINFPFNRTEKVNLPITITGLEDATNDGSEFGYIDISTS
jgi:hypothetical protein